MTAAKKGSKLPLWGQAFLIALGVPVWGWFLANQPNSVRYSKYLWLFLAVFAFAMIVQLVQLSGFRLPITTMRQARPAALKQALLKGILAGILTEILWWFGHPSHYLPGFGVFVAMNLIWNDYHVARRTDSTRNSIIGFVGAILLSIAWIFLAYRVLEI